MSSAGGHLRSPVVFDDIDYAFREYDPFGAYGQSKTANVLFAVEASRRWAGGDGITANALMPGGIATALQRHLPLGYNDEAREQFRQAGSRFKSVEQGAATSVLLAASPLLDGVGGRYFENCNEAVVVESRDGGDRRSGALCAGSGECRAAVGRVVGDVVIGSRDRRCRRWARVASGPWPNPISPPPVNC